MSGFAEFDNSMIRESRRSRSPKPAFPRTSPRAFWSLPLLMIFVVLALPRADASVAITADARALHVLNRLGFGPRPGDIRRVEAMGIDNYIYQQLHPQSIPLPDSLNHRLQSLYTLRLDPVQIFLKYGPPRGRRGHKPEPQAIKLARERSRIVLEQAEEARLLRVTDSPRQLQEVMVDFWYNHFNVYAGKGLDHLWAGAYEDEAIRPYALGRFRDLLDATAKHPAMLFYLDNWQNTAPGSPGAHGRFDGINENYAREVMELHTCRMPQWRGEPCRMRLSLATSRNLNRTSSGYFPVRRLPRAAGLRAFAGNLPAASAFCMRAIRSLSCSSRYGLKSRSSGTLVSLSSPMDLT